MLLQALIAHLMASLTAGESVAHGRLLGLIQPSAMDMDGNVEERGLRPAGGEGRGWPAWQ